MKRGLKSSLSSLSNPVSYTDDFQAEKNIPTDPFFPLQWYLRNTGQNGGKIHLDLNVQAAWNQGITGKNVTTAIMDDGKIKIKHNHISIRETYLEDHIIFHLVGLKRKYVFMFYSCDLVVTDRCLKSSAKLEMKSNTLLQSLLFCNSCLGILSSVFYFRNFAFGILFCLLRFFPYFVDSAFLVSVFRCVIPFLNCQTLSPSH